MQHILINASNIHIGGGKVILEDLLSATRSYKKITFIVYVDYRLKFNSYFEGNVIIKKIKKYQRFLVYFYIESSAKENDIVIYLNNIPPVLKHKCKTFLVQSNRFVIDKFSLSGFSFKTKIRIIAERLFFLMNKGNSDYIIVQSDSMFLALQKNGINKKKILILASKKTDDENKIRNINLKRQKDFFLYVSSDDPHKNHYKLIEAWCLLSEEHLYPKLVLTIDGKTSLHNYIEKQVGNFGLNIEIKPNLDRKELLSLYNQATALIFPSLFESYGLPIIEANQHELPIIASELDYVRDILDPVETFDPHSARSICRSVKRFLKITDGKTKIFTPVDFIKTLIEI